MKIWILGEEDNFHFLILREKREWECHLNESLFGCVFVGICRFPFDNSRARSRIMYTDSFGHWRVMPGARAQTSY